MGDSMFLKSWIISTAKTEDCLRDYLSKKSPNGNFINFASNGINWLQTSRSRI